MTDENRDPAASLGSLAQPLAENVPYVGGPMDGKSCRLLYCESESVCMIDATHHYRLVWVEGSAGATLVYDEANGCIQQPRTQEDDSMSDDDKGSAAMLGSLDAIKGVDAGPKAAERLFLGTSKHDGSPEPTAHLPNTVHAGCRSRESDAGTGDIVEHRWISVTERLPPGDVRVLIWCGNFVDFATLNWKYGWMYDDYGSPKPTHWMPLPAPPTDAK